MEQALQPLIGGSGSARRTTEQQQVPQVLEVRFREEEGWLLLRFLQDRMRFNLLNSVSRLQDMTKTNSLLVVASPQDYKVLEAFIARLDVPQRQVLVDGVVMDVNLTNDYGCKG